MSSFVDILELLPEVLASVRKYVIIYVFNFVTIKYVNCIPQ